MTGHTIRRRAVTIPAVFAIFAACWLGAPVLLPLAVAVDVVRWIATRRPWMATRLVLFLLAYSLAETAGIIALAGSWLLTAGGRVGDLRSMTFAVQKAWAGFVLRVCRIVFGLRITAAGLDAVRPAPFLLLARHASIVDNLLPAWFISRPLGTHIRYVMKHELVVDPALDIAGHRLGNLFIRRGSGEGELEVGAVRRLAESLTSDEAILIYPEGSRFSEEKRQRSVATVSRRSPRLRDRVERLHHLLAPRPGGTLALLEGCRADVVVMAHRGLDGFARVADIWRGAMVGRQIEVEFWRIARADIPEGRSERIDWLFDLWARMDRWIAGPA